MCASRVSGRDSLQHQNLFASALWAIRRVIPGAPRQDTLKLARQLCRQIESGRCDGNLPADTIADLASFINAETRGSVSRAEAVAIIQSVARVGVQSKVS